ncbi:MAG: hypothetical protein M3Z84_01590 [Actinomycetota bacterium]|nr:hypothetical protein [Actinomycetota bacterium]
MDRFVVVVMPGVEARPSFQPGEHPAPVQAFAYQVPSVCPDCERELVTFTGLLSLNMGR